MQVSRYIPNRPGLGAVENFCQIAVIVGLVFLAQDAFAMPYPVCEPEDGCGGRGAGLWELLLFALACAVSLGVTVAFIFVPGALWNLLRGRKPNDSRGLEQGMTFIFMIIPMVLLLSLPGICFAFLVNAVVGPISSFFFLGILCVWWGFLWWKFVQMKRNGRGKVDLEGSHTDTNLPSSHSIDPASRPGKSLDSRAPVAVAAVSPREIKRQKYPDLHPDDVNQLAMKSLLDYRVSSDDRMGCCIIRGQPDVHAVVVYGQNLNDAKADFLEWARHSAPPDWNDFLSHGFKNPYLRHSFTFPKSIPENERCAADEVEQLRADGLEVRTWTPEDRDKNNRSYAPNDGPINIKGGGDAKDSRYLVIGSIVEKTDRAVHGRVDYSQYHPQVPLDEVEHRLSPDTLRQITEHVAKKNKQEVTKLIDINGHAGVATGSTKHPSLGPYIPWNLSFSTDQLITATDIEDFGTDMLEFLGREVEHVHWHISGRRQDRTYLENALEIDAESCIENFGGEFMDVVNRVALQYLGERGWNDAKGGEGPDATEQDIKNFGADMIATVEELMAAVFAKNLLNQAPYTTTHHAGRVEPEKKDDKGLVSVPAKLGNPTVPFSVGTKVTHKKKGDEYGTGVILSRDAQYLTVEFPAVHKTMPMMTETVELYLTALPE